MRPLRRFPPWLLLATPMLLSAAVRGLWAPDEPRYAQVAREAWDSGQPLVLHLCGEVYADKPPLVYWLAGLCGAISGWSEFAMRLPSILATLGTAWLVGRFARAAWSEREAQIAPAVFLTFALVTEMGGRLQLDPTLSLLCTASLYLATAGGRFGASRRQVLAAGACLGLAALTKGPVAWVDFGLVWIAWMAVERRRWRRPRAVDAGFVALAIAPVAVWAGTAIAIEPALGEELLYRQHLGRMTEAISHPGPVWEPLLELLALLLPWTPVVVVAAVRGLRGLRGVAPADPALSRASLWLVVLLVFFSLVAEKRNLYLLPAYPAAALLAARWIATAVGRHRLLTDAPATALAALGAAACGVFAFEAQILAVVPDATAIGLRGVAVGIPIVAAALLALAAARRGEIERWARRLAWTWLALGAGIALAVYPLVDPLKSADSLARVLAARPERPVEIPCFGVQPEGFRFYSGRPTVADPTGERTLSALARDGADFLALVAARDLDLLPDGLRTAGLEVLHQERVGSRVVILFGSGR